MTRDDCIYAAVLSHIGWQQIATGSVYKRAQFDARLAQATGLSIPQLAVSTVIDRMAQEGFAEVVETGITEPYIKLNYKPINEYVVSRASDQKSPEYIYKRVGKQLLIDLLGTNNTDNVELAEPPQGTAPPALSEASRAELVVELDRVAVKLDAENVSNEVKSQALSYITAARVLAESPEPPVGIIWALMERASHLAGIASLFVAIIGLFGH